MNEHKVRSFLTLKSQPISAKVTRTTGGGQGGGSWQGNQNQGGGQGYGNQAPQAQQAPQGNDPWGSQGGQGGYGGGNRGGNDPWNQSAAEEPPF